jgi:hypothetical protein
MVIIEKSGMSPQGGITPEASILIAQKGPATTERLLSALHVILQILIPIVKGRRGPVVIVQHVPDLLRHHGLSMSVQKQDVGPLGMPQMKASFRVP